MAKRLQSEQVIETAARSTHRRAKVAAEVRERRRWRPTDEQATLFPEISGNAINGLGETARRRPAVVYWDDPEMLPHGRLLDYFYKRFLAVPALRDAYFSGRGDEVLDEVAPVRREASPDEWSLRVKEQARALGCEMVGIAAMRDEWVYDGRSVPEPWIVIVGLLMDQPRLSRAPATADEPSSAVEIAVNLARITRVSNALTNWIRAQGWAAEARPGKTPTGAVSLIPAAIACGFGELGKHGSLIHPEYGSSFRLAAVTTTLPLRADEPVEFGADDFCARCQVCVNACPPDAIFPDKQPVRGDHKWYVDFDRCVPFLNDHYGCGICVAVCPWSRPGVAPRLVDKLAQRRRTRTGE